MPYVKAAADWDRRAGNRAGGRFPLTGSTQVLLLPQLSDSLTGRMQQAQLHPFPVCETERRDSGFLEALFGAGFEPRRLEPLGPKLIEQVMTGGCPEARLRERTHAPTGSGHTYGSFRPEAGYMDAVASTPCRFSATCGIKADRTY